EPGSNSPVKLSLLIQVRVPGGIDWWLNQRCGSLWPLSRVTVFSRRRSARRLGLGASSLDCLSDRGRWAGAQVTHTTFVVCAESSFQGPSGAKTASRERRSGLRTLTSTSRVLFRCASRRFASLDQAVDNLGSKPVTLRKG